jgi:hypothetical protein
VFCFISSSSFKLRLLAIVLALALIWYSLNPTQRPAIRKKRDAKLPDEKRQNIEPRSMPTILPIAFRPMERIVELLPSSDEGEDDFDWPEFIDG